MWGGAVHTARVSLRREKHRIIWESRRGRTMQSTVVSTRGTPASKHPARRGSDPVIADVG
jgi:hypothetical protein